MNNCFCELPDLDNPFTVDDILCEEDLDLIHNYSQQSNLGADKVQWHDSTSDFYTGKEFKQNFSGVGYITDKKVMRTLNEFVRDNFPDEFIKHGTQDQMHDEMGLGEQGILIAIKAFIN